MNGNIYIVSTLRRWNRFCSANIEDRVNTNTGAITDDTYWDELVVVVEITDSSGNVVETKTWTMDTWYEWTSSNAHSSNEVQEGSTYWQIHEDNIEIYNHTDKVGTIRTPNAVGDIRFRITGYDKGNWDGYYGPIIKDLKTWFTYRANPCDDTALYDASCPGYATAYAAYQYDQNCAANALYDSGCPGYATAYYNQQCSADATYDSGCPGYATAYYNQQCSADPLYDSGCDGYATAYYNQQCSANPLYDSGCSGYANAYYNQQCGIDAAYDSGCTGYEEAITEFTGSGMNVSGQGSDYIFIYRGNNPTVYDILLYNLAELKAGTWRFTCTQTTVENCTDNNGVISDASNPSTNYIFLYTKDADGNVLTPDSSYWYKFTKQSYLTTQCNISSLYSPMCEGYATAYYNQQCSANALYDSGCSGYAAAYLSQQCESNQLYSTSCSGYAAAYLSQQCSANTLYNSACPGYDAAYLTQQCGLDTLYNSACEGYDAAYLTQQCGLDATYDETCTGYADANFEKQCGLDDLYSPGCAGYDQAFLTQQCSYNTQYDPQCNGYVEPVIENDIGDIGLGTGDSIVDNIISMPELPIMLIPAPEPMPEPMPEPEPEMPEIESGNRTA